MNEILCTVADFRPNSCLINKKHSHLLIIRQQLHPMRSAEYRTCQERKTAFGRVKQWQCSQTTITCLHPSVWSLATHSHPKSQHLLPNWTQKRRPILDRSILRYVCSKSNSLSLRCRSVKEQAWTVQGDWETKNRLLDFSMRTDSVQRWI